MKLDLPPTQHAIQLVGPDELRLNTSKPVVVPTGHQLLVKVEATGLCFSDMKLLHQFTKHPRKSDVISGLPSEELAGLPSYVPNDMPTVPGHETVVRVIAVGDEVKLHKVGQRYAVQTDYRCFETSAGSNAGFGYTFEGALQEYVIIDERVAFDYDSDESFLIPVDEDRSSAAIALVEPWACVENSLTTPERQTILAGGRLLVIVENDRLVRGLVEAFPGDGGPREIFACCPSEQHESLQTLMPGVRFLDDLARLPDDHFDDIVYFGSRRQTIEEFNTKLGFQGIANIVTGGKEIGEPVSIGIGRIHYGLRRWIGTTSDSASESYSIIPANGEPRTNDRCLVIGAGGPMGQMQVLRAIYSRLPGLSIVATETDPSRLKVLAEKIAPNAKQRGIPLEISDPGASNPGGGFTYITLMVPSPKLLSEALDLCGKGAILNVFAGIPAFTIHPVDLDALIRKRCFLFGTSGSVLSDMKNVLKKVQANELNTELSVDAVAGMRGAIDGLHAVDSRTRAGKIIVYPQLHDLDLVPLEDMPTRFPSVAEKLSNGCWTKEAEKELLRVATRA